MVVIDGRPRGAGELVEVTQKDAKMLLSEGYALKPDAPTSVPAAEERKAFDGSGAEIAHTDDGRRPLTPRTILDGEEQIGR